MNVNLFPREMDKTSLSLEGVAQRLSYFTEQAHLLHLQTPSYAEHKALNELYDGVFDLKDSILEKMMGYMGQKVKSYKIDILQDYSPGRPQQLCQEIDTFARQLFSLGMPDVENLAQELSGLSAQVRYLLTLS